MAIAKFTVACTAVYHSELEVPDDIADNRDDVLTYIREHLGEAPVDELEWLADWDPEEAVMEEDIRDVRKEIT